MSGFRVASDKVVELPQVDNQAASQRAEISAAQHLREAQEAKNQAMRTLITALQVVSQRFTTAVAYAWSASVMAALVASVWYLWLRILNEPDPTKLIGASIYSAFCLAVLWLRRGVGVLAMLALLPLAAHAQQQVNVVNNVVAPAAGYVTQTAVTCGATSTPLGVTGTTYLSVWIAPSASQTVCFGWGATAATMSPPSQCFAAGTQISWSGGTGSCIVASGSQAVVVTTR